MPRQCTICAHPKRAEIEDALASGRVYRTIADDYGLSETALKRHKNDHMAAALAKASEAESIAADDILAQIRYLETKALGILAGAEASGSAKVALGAIREARACLELLAKVRGQLDERPQVNVLVTSPDWLATRAALFDALRPFPEARIAVAERLATIGGSDDE